MSQQNIDLVRRGYDAFGRGDMPGVFSLMDERIEFILANDSPYGERGPLVGQQQITEGLFARLAAEWDGFTVKPATLRAGEDFVLAEGRHGGTHKATGRVNDAEFAHIWTVRNGKLTRMKEYTNTARLREAMGVR